MEISYKGANCIEIVTKKATMVIDGALGDLGPGCYTKDSVQLLYTLIICQEYQLVVNGPGSMKLTILSLACS
jgi:hypothetical protein